MDIVWVIVSGLVGVTKIPDYFLYFFPGAPGVFAKTYASEP